MTHTPGPWKVYNAWGPTPDNRIAFLRIGTEIGSTVIRTTSPNCDMEAYESDIHLIAAAPELLEAVEELTALVTAGGGEHAVETWRKARAAIAKARGEE